MKSLIQKLLFPIYSHYPSYRGSDAFRRISRRFNYEPYEQALFYAIDYMNTIGHEGDYLEFGVWKGRTFTAAYHMAQSFNLPMQFFGFDSFKGLPELTKDDAYNNEYEAGQYACSQTEFERILKKNKVNRDKVTLVEGYYETSLTPTLRETLDIKAAGIVMIDCDLYESTKLALDFITDYVTSGTVILFEDWFCFRNDPTKGEQRAFNEWLSANPQLHASDFAFFPTLKAFVMYRDETH